MVGENRMIKEELDSSSTDSFATPVSSLVDLMDPSPKDYNTSAHDSINDLLTGDDFEMLCDNSMIEHHTDVFLDPNDLDFLVKCTDSKKSLQKLDREKDSLMVKFDPLYSRRQTVNYRPNNTINIPDCDKGYETGSSASTIDQCVATPKRTSSMQYNLFRDKPMQVVPPAINHTIASTTPSQMIRAVPPLVRSASAIMSPATVATERLINFASNTPPIQSQMRSPLPDKMIDGSDRLYHLRVILQKQEQEIHQLYHENRELKTQLHDTERKLSEYTQDMEEKVKKLMHEKKTLLEMKYSLAEEVNEKIRSNKQMSIVMEEFENTMSVLISEQQKNIVEKQQIEDNLTAERDEALKHLSSMESSFNDLLSKYEKCKTLIMESKARENTFQEQLVEYEKAMKKYDNVYENLKKVTSESLAKANENLNDTKKSYAAELTKSNATIKKQEVMIMSLQESLAQKERDNQKLTSICDDLITKVHY